MPPILIVAAVVIGLSTGGGVGAVAVTLGIFAATTPAAWLRRRGRQPHDGGEVRTSLKALGLAFAWAFAVVIAGVAVAALVP